MRRDFLNRRFALLLLASVASGLLLAVAYPRFDMSEAAWLALVPLTLVSLHTTAKECAAWSYLSGTVFFLGSLSWLLPLVKFAGVMAVLGWMLLSLFLALYVAAWGWFVAALNTRLGIVSTATSVPTRIGRNLLFAILVACGWVATEIIRTHLFTGFPWNLLGVSQYRNLALIQFVTVTGVYGVSWLICFVNVCVALTILRLKNEFRASRTGRQAYKPHLELMTSLFLVILAIMVGYRSIEADRARAREQQLQTLAVCLVQPNIAQEEKWDEQYMQLIYDRFEDLTGRAIAEKPDLIVWPEAATPRPLRYDKTAIRIVTNAAARSGGYVLLGSMTVQAAEAQGRSNASSREVWYNSAYVMTPKLELLEPYHKQHLVPFGEFVPLERWLPFMKKVTPIGDSIARGRERKLFPVRDVRVGVAICFEDLFPDVFRRFVRDGAQLMVNITNDAWYRESAGAYQHMANSVFRAVENRVSFVRCANTGYSCFVDSTGRNWAHIHGSDKEGIFVKGCMTKPVVVRDSSEPLTFYTRHGDVFAWSCFGVAVLVFVRFPVPVRKKP